MLGRRAVSQAVSEVGNRRARLRPVAGRRAGGARRNLKGGMAARGGGGRAGLTQAGLGTAARQQREPRRFRLVRAHDFPPSLGGPVRVESLQDHQSKMKKFAPNLLDATHEALVKSYWYKKDLRSFLHRTGVQASLLAEYDWGPTGPAKYHTVRAIIDRLACDPGTGTPILQAIVDGLVEQNDFPQLKNLEDAQQKVREAKAAVNFLKDLLGHKTVVERAERARDEKRTEAARASDEAARRKESIKTLAHRFSTLSSQADHNQRGRNFEPLLRDLFVLYDLDPRSSFSSPGEQTDGSLVIDGTYMLVEAKWTNGPIHPDEIRNFRAKIEDKLDSTLGLFISMSGFTKEAVHRAAQGRRLLILMDGMELAYIFQGLWSFDDLLRRKLREAAETGDVFFKPW